MELLGRLKEIKDPSDMTKEILKEIIDYMESRRWIKDAFPPAEQEVLIIVEHKPFRKEPHRRVLRAFYEDGTTKEEDSSFFWEGIGSGPIPLGWYETTDYGENYEVADQVIGWKPMPDPWE